MILLIFFGVVPFIVAALLTRRVARGVLPMSPAASRRLAVHYLASVAVCVGIAHIGESDQSFRLKAIGCFG